MQQVTINMNMAQFIFLLIVVHFVCSALPQELSESQCNAAAVTNAEKYTMQYGDPQNCPQPDTVNILETLPGAGWDNLRNVAMGPVLSLNYSACRITPDRKFLIPDDIDVEAIKESDVHVFSELITNFSNYTSMTSRTINLEAHASFHFLKISGSFSHNYQSAKQRIAGDKTTTSRSELRYRQYTVRSQPDPQLHPVFLDRVLDIASFIQENDTESARYQSQILVRDYGTHYINYVESGALIVQEDQLNSSYIKNMDCDSSTIRASAAVSFLKLIGFSASYSQTVTNEHITAYLQSRVDTHTVTMGGPNFRANFSINQWIDGMDNNLVTVDRNGDPLYYVISTGSLPMLPLDTVREVAAIIKESVTSYYKHNVYRGCTSVDAPNFSYYANLDDGTCGSPLTNHSFGGVYQSCTGGLCSASSTQVNPTTQGYTCPHEYTPVLIYQQTAFQCIRHCRHFGKIKFSCHDDCSYTETSQNAAHYEAYWCAATGPVSQNSGYLFGGVYTDTTNNALTNDRSCPEHFVALRLGTSLGLYVCMSDDYELGFRYSIPFAGLFSCQSGNPLALSRPITQSQHKDNVMTLATFTYQAGADAWPRSCPSGYSQHLFAINEGCEINYCVKADVLSQISLPVIKRPPFHHQPRLRHNTTRILVSSTQHLWMKLGGYTRWKRTDILASDDANIADIFPSEIDGTDISPSSNGRSKTSGHSNEHSTTKIVLLSVFSTLVFGILVAVMGYYAFRYYHKRKTGERAPLVGQDGGNYPPIGERDDHV